MIAIRLHTLHTLRTSALRSKDIRAWLRPPAAVAGAALVAAALLAGCGSPEEAAGVPPVELSPVAGTDLQQVTLTDEAADRLGIQTGTVAQSSVAVDGGRPASHKVVPYAAVVYDSDGATWAYTETAPRTYLRAPITVSTIQGDVAVLKDGPAVGTAVVIIGAPELLGAEAEISGEE